MVDEIDKADDHGDDEVGEINRSQRLDEVKGICEVGDVEESPGQRLRDWRDQRLDDGLDQSEEVETGVFVSNARCRRSQLSRMTARANWFNEVNAPGKLNCGWDSTPNSRWIFLTKKHVYRPLKCTGAGSELTIADRGSCCEYRAAA